MKGKLCMKISFILLVAVIFASCTSTSDEDLINHAEAGDFDRYNSIISFQLPETLAHKEYHLTDSDGNSYAFQRPEERRVGKECRCRWAWYDYKKDRIILLVCCRTIYRR